ncbi:hypothetical protein KQ313_07685 [Synechococcus sp. CS-1325]|uniref:hypothetical protein n=1 Tax=unclassified Synechococcus TaxID=2626047 RepID=UPI0021A6784A|nr:MULTISPECIES: hypothetical protein [unclassified Synechococcus]MCT0199556.1 hypothetical protein [Synechococcus sp. CS-1325]MCT0233024.1 hypothetical protein [Synechococcus sp. CS-1327]
MLRKLRKSIDRASQLVADLGGSAISCMAKIRQLDDKWERNACLFGRLAAFQVQRMEEIDTLADVEFQVFSQFGEDGIIEWLVSSLNLQNRTFVEFGVENYLEANTRFLLLNRNWTGLVFDGDAGNMNVLRSSATYWRNDIQAHAAFITAENIQQLIEQNGFFGPLGILSIDLDGNDYWILKALGGLRPDILVLECNPVFGDRHAVTVPYDAKFERFRSHYSGLLFGASIAALRELAEGRGYEFLGTCMNGLNAFFVRADLAPQLAGRIKRRIAWPAIHRDSRDPAGRLSYVRGRERFDLIAGCMVHCCRSGRMVRLGDLGEPYSAEWLRAMALPRDLLQAAA